MHAFRFNPVFEQWVLLGTSYSASPEIQERHLLDVGKNKRFVAASHPRQPFLIEPPEKSGVSNGDQLYADQPPVGEYELLLYKGGDPCFTWDYKEWLGWLNLVKQRLYQIQHNPYLHHVYLTLNTALLDSIDGYQRVGDLIATSHPLAGMSVPLTDELAHKLKKSDRLLKVALDKYGTLLSPAAPLKEKELWYLPETAWPSIAQTNEEELKAFAKLLSTLMCELKAAYAREEFVITIHTALVAGEQDTTWWAQIHRLESTAESPLPVRPLPEVFVHKLKQLL